MIIYRKVGFYDMSLRSFINERKTLTGLVLKKGSLNTKRFFGLDTEAYRNIEEASRLAKSGKLQI